MRLNWLGRTAMNSSLRAMMQRQYVAPLLERLGGRVPGGRVLEVGCGGGGGVEIIMDRFGAAEVTEGFGRMRAPTPESFISALDRRGIVVGRSFVRSRLAPLTQAAGDFIGVGRLEA